MKSESEEAGWERSALHGLLLLTALLLAPLLFLPPLADDHNFLEALRSPERLTFILTSQGPAQDMRFWRPLAFAAFWLEDLLGGALLTHTSSLVLHLLCGRLLWGLCRPFCSPGVALLATSLVLLHPRRVEAVAWASAQADLGMTLAVGLGLKELLRPRPRTGRLLSWQLIALAFKETGVVLAFWACALTLAGGTGTRQSGSSMPTTAGSMTEAVTAAVTADQDIHEMPALLGWKSLGLCAVAGGWFAVRSLLLGHSPGGYARELELSAPAATAALGLLKPLVSGTMAWVIPLHLGAQEEEALFQRFTTGWAGGLVGLTAVVVLLAVAWIFKRRPRPELARGSSKGPRLLLGLYGLSLVPTFGLTIGLEGSSDRYLTLPGLILAPLTAGLLHAGARGILQGGWRLDARWTTRLARAAGVGLGMGLLLLTQQRVLTWKSAADVGQHFLTGLEQHLRPLREAQAQQTPPGDALRFGIPIVLMGAPDRVAGIGIFSAGLGAALRLRGLEPPPEVVIGAWMEQEEVGSGPVTWAGQHTDTQTLVEGISRGAWRLKAGAARAAGTPDPERHQHKAQSSLRISTSPEQRVLCFDGDSITWLGWTP